MLLLALVLSACLIGVIPFSHIVVRLMAGAALLVLIARRLRDLGFDVPDSPKWPEDRLYDMLAAEDSDSAHSRYNALIRTLVSFERAAACVRP